MKLLTQVSILISLLAASANAQDSDRSISADDIHFSSIAGSTEIQIDFAVRAATQRPCPTDICFDASIFIDGLIVSIHPFVVQIVPNGGGQTCNGSCPTGDCSAFGPDSECSDFSALGGQGCACDIVVYGGGSHNVPTNSVVGIGITPAGASVPEFYTSNDTAFRVYTDIFPNVCNGDGGDQLGCTNCPCVNNATAGVIGGCLNSAGSSMRLLTSGDPSVSLPPAITTDLRFDLTGAPPSAFCILNSGDAIAPTNPLNPCFALMSGTQAIQFDGLRCAVQNTRRHGGRSADVNGDVGATNSPWGGSGNPGVGIAVAGGGFAAGQTRFFQVINRDNPLAVCMRGLNTSQASSVTFTP